MSTPKNSRNIARSGGPSRSSYPLASSAPTPQSIIEQDLRNISQDDTTDGDLENVVDDTDSEPLFRVQSHQLTHGYSSLGSYRRPSYIATAGIRPSVLPVTHNNQYLTDDEWNAVREEERSLLRDNNCIPPRHPRRDSASTLKANIFSWMKRPSEDASFVDSSANAEEQDGPSERTPLMRESLQRQISRGQQPYGGMDSPTEIDQKWDEAVEAGMISTTWQREAKVLARNSRTLILTFLLQYSLVVVSVFTVGHIGKNELGAVSLGSMTANITGYAVFQGLATSLDTLCSQAYGSGHKKLVGLQMLRMTYFLWICIIPIAIIWLAGTQILTAIVPEREIAELAGLYLKITLIGTPGYAAFEAGKRFVQAQGLFSCSLYILLFLAPLNVLLHWLLVWRFGLGFVGAPISVAIVELLMPICLFFYVRFFASTDCWGGFTRAAFRNWWPMVRLALPGLAMIEAEVLAFEVLTLSASWLGATELASQSVLATICSITFQLPFPMSVGASTRIANLVGAGLPDAAKLAAKVTMVSATIIGVLNITLLSALREYIPRLFTQDADVRALVARVLPVCAAFQVFDALAVNISGILRGIGRQEIGGWVNIIVYYAVAIPVSFATCFGLHWELYGLWTGPAIGLFLITVVEGWFVYKSSWERAVREAEERNAGG